MQERTLLGIAIICILLGIPSLFIMSETHAFFLEEKSLLFSDEEDTVKISGKVVGVTKKEEFTLLEIEQTATIPLIIFEEANLEEGMVIEAIGKVEIYQGKKEMLASEILRK